MILGLVLFLGAHTFTTQREARARAIASMGEGSYKIGYALVSAGRACADRLGLCALPRDRLDPGVDAAEGAEASQRRC